MQRKEINIFGTSFLDLLSGAFAAVIILFIIVPKMSSEQQDALEEMERLHLQVQDLGQMMEQLQNSVPQELFEQVQRQIEDLQNSLSELSEQIRQLQNELAATREENERMRNELAELDEVRQQCQELQQENERLRQQIAELQQQDERGVSDGKVFGLNADLGVVCIWPENVDVDLYVKDLSTGQICYYRNKTTPFGNLNEDIRERTSPDDDRYELFYQQQVIPGRYLLYVNIFGGQDSNWSGQPAHVDGYAVLYPGKANQVKIPFRQIVLTQKGINKNIGTLVVTTDNIILQ